MLSPDARVHHAHSLGAVRVSLPALPIGATFLERWAVREMPGMSAWGDEFYDSVAPATFVLRNVTVHGSAGIIQVGDSVVSETLEHTAPALHGYSVVPGGIVLQKRRMTRLSGTHVSLLAGAGANFFHAVMDGPFRLSMIPADILQASTTLLCSAGAVAHRDMLELLRPPAHLDLQDVDDADAFAMETLVLPLTVHGIAHFNPCVKSAFSRVADVADGDGGFPRRFYIDRRGAALRRLVNEDELVKLLVEQGFVAMRPELLSLADQVRLFRGAEAIVAPHGAGLTNIGFCKPGCVVLELHMDRHVHWAFRHLAALCNLRYDCVLGRAIGQSKHTQTLQWQISTAHVTAAIATMLPS